MIKIIDHTKCQLNKEDGTIIFNIIKPLLDNGDDVHLSFIETRGISPTFINCAFIELLEYFPFDYIKRHLHFHDISKFDGNLIKKRFTFEVEKKLTDICAEVL